MEDSDVKQKQKQCSPTVLVMLSAPQACEAREHIRSASTAHSMVRLVGVRASLPFVSPPQCSSVLCRAAAASSPCGDRAVPALGQEDIPEATNTWVQWRTLLGMMMWQINAYAQREYGILIKRDLALDANQVLAVQFPNVDASSTTLGTLQTGVSSTLIQQVWESRISFSFFTAANLPAPAHAYPQPAAQQSLLGLAFVYLKNFGSRPCRSPQKKQASPTVAILKPDNYLIEVFHLTRAANDFSRSCFPPNPRIARRLARCITPYTTSGASASRAPARSTRPETRPTPSALRVLMSRHPRLPFHRSAQAVHHYAPAFCDQATARLLILLSGIAS
ncbi:hypothetical protein B0H19DRAFT_1261840 [Mycena capillaripes]|nr:hypothetical protein B0H19DRAFT_1261840 [Mycena capillaripes]